MTRSERGHLGQLAGHTSVMLAGRVVQAVCGIATFVILARTLKAEAYGQVLTALAIPAMLGAILGDALSDAEIVDEGSPAARQSVARAVWIISLGFTGLITALPVHLALTLCSVAGAAYVSVAVTAAPRVARARRNGNAIGIASANAAGALATVLAVLVLTRAGVRYWPVFNFVFVLQPLFLVWLPHTPAPVQRLPLSNALRHLLHTVGPFVASQAAWPFIGQLNILVLRLVLGAEAVGIYGAMMRIVDFLGVIGPIVGTFALPTFAAARSLQAPTYSHVVGRLNVLIGCVAVFVLAIGVQFGWLAWRAIYPGMAFPADSYVFMAVGASISAACGLPDRVLQAAGEARLVAVAALTAAAVYVPTTALLTASFGIAGAAVAWLLVIAGVNIALLRASGLSNLANRRHVALIAIGTSAALLTLQSAASIRLSLLFGALAAAGVSAIATVTLRDTARALSV